MEFLRTKVMAYLFIGFGVIFTGWGVASLLNVMDGPAIVIAPGLMCIFAGAVMMTPTGRPEE